jgi:hypothetical protein
MGAAVWAELDKWTSWGLEIQTEDELDHSKSSAGV